MNKRKWISEIKIDKIKLKKFNKSYILYTYSFLTNKMIR